MNLSRVFCALLAIILMAGCTPDHPFDQPGTWSLDANGSANDDNLHAMVVNPQDLIHGNGTTTALGAEAAPPIRRLFTGKRYPLPASNVLKVEISNYEPTPPAGEADHGGQ